MTASPELAALADVCARLEAASIPYMLTGSLAASYYARPRMTRDIDLVIAFEGIEVDRLGNALGAEYHLDADALKLAFSQGRPWNVLHLPSLVKIDLIPRKPTRYRRDEFERRRKVELAGIPLWLVSVEDLILSKLEWSLRSRSEAQRRDIKSLLDEAPVDRAYLDRWAAHLEVSGWLAEIEHE